MVINLDEHKNGFTMKYTDEQGKTIKVTVEGKTELPFWQHDLKLRAAIGLLGTVDFKDFADANKEDLYFNLMEELRKTIDAGW